MSKLARIQVDENGVRGLKVVAKAFIIPNQLYTANDFGIDYLIKDRLNAGNKLLEINKENKHTPGLSDKLDPEKDMFVHLWYHNGSSQNICDHGMMILDDDGNKKYFRPDIEFIPAQFFKNRKEKDTFIIKVPTEYYDDAEYSNPQPIDLYLQIFLSQSDSRYGHMGNFEDVLQKLIVASSN